MSEPFISEIRIFSFGFQPKGWALCNGQLLPINQNQPLFSLLGTTYGGDGRVNFGLPDLQGRVPIHMGNGHILGEWGGEQAHTLSISEIPTHVHYTNASSSVANTVVPTGAILGSPLNMSYRSPDALTSLHPGTVSNTGGYQAHINMQPFLVLNFSIALQGVFPSEH
jgi:microcystin-dependent protein